MTLSISAGANALADTGTRRITGLAGPYETPTALRAGGFRIVLKRDAFKKFLSTPQDVYLLNQHNSEKPLARTANGTMRLWQDSSGVHFTAELPNTTDGNDLHEKIRSGLLDKMSVHFGFDSDDDVKWTVGADKVPQFELHVGTLSEVSIVTWPAITTSSVRSLRATENSAPPAAGEFRKSLTEVRKELEEIRRDMDRRRRPRTMTVAAAQRELKTLLDRSPRG